MKKNDIAKLKNRGAEELLKDAVEMREKLWELRREIAGGKVKNVRSRRTMRRDLARVLTFAQQKGLPGSHNREVSGSKNKES